MSLLKRLGAWLSKDLTTLFRKEQNEMTDPTAKYTHEDVLALAALMEASILASGDDRTAVADLASAQKAAAADLAAVQQRNETNVGTALSRANEKHVMAVQAEAAVTAKLQAMGLASARLSSTKQSWAYYDSTPEDARR